MYCVQVTDDQYRRVAKLAGVADIDLAPIDDEEFVEKRISVDALLFLALQQGVEQLEANYA